MSDHIRELLQRNLQEVFGEGNATRRRAAIEELYTEDCVLYAPLGIFVGPEALDKFAGDLRATHPHFVYTPHGEAQALHNAGRLAWGSGPRGEFAQLHRLGCGRRSRWKDRGTVCVSRFRAVVAAQVRLDDHRCEYPVPVCAPLGSREVLRATFNRRSLLGNRTAAPTAPNDCSRRERATPP